MKIVIDTNIFVSGIFWGGKPGILLELWRDDKIELMVTPDIFDEYIRIIKKIGKNDLELVKEWLDFIYPHAHIVENKVELNVCRDPFDNMFLECALSCGAQYIVSGDDDLLSLGKIEEIQIITVSEFIKRFIED